MQPYYSGGCADCVCKKLAKDCKLSNSMRNYQIIYNFTLILLKNLLTYFFFILCSRGFVYFMFHHIYSWINSIWLHNAQVYMF